MKQRMNHQESGPMEFEITDDTTVVARDQEISALLSQVYVQAGYTRADEAQTLFEPAAVRTRGTLFSAREKDTGELAGMVILVPHGSPACRLARENEAEIHLLGVDPKFRGQGLGRRLVQTAVQRAKHNGYSRLVLWTQASMHAAQSLYESSGFIHIDEMNRNGREFKVYELSLGG